MNLRVLFVGEGSSDARITVHIERIAENRKIGVLISSPDFSGLHRVPGHSVKERLSVIGRVPDPCDLLVVHRDADSASPDPRFREIAAAVDAAKILAPFACVVPVRRTEAWLLLDERAIRQVAGNPAGRQPLDLPTPREAERRPNPKALLAQALVDAAGVKGRRLDIFRRRFDAHRAQLLEQLDPAGPVRNLSSWRRFVGDLEYALDRAAERSGSGL